MAGYTIAFTDIKSVVVSQKSTGTIIEYHYELPKKMVRNDLGSVKRLDVLFFDKENSAVGLAEQLDEYLWNRIFYYEARCCCRFDMVVIVTTSEIQRELYFSFKEFLNDDCCPMILMSEIMDEQIQSVISTPLYTTKIPTDGILIN